MLGPKPQRAHLQAIDTITPLARGCSMLLAGPQRDPQSATLLRTLCHQAGTPVHVVYGTVGAATEALQARVEELREAGVMPQSTVVAADAGAPLGEQYAALCAAISIGEGIRDAGGHALVALDSMECVVRLWDNVTAEAGRAVGALNTFRKR